jgi:SPP1 family predicted phage head-tail adaptor
MRAGKLRTTVTFRRKTVSYSDTNKPVETWADAFTVYAEIITDGGKEFYAAQKKHSDTSSVFKIRYRGDIQTDMRIKCGNKIFEILWINDVGYKHIELQISAKDVD